MVQPTHAELAPEPSHCICERAPVCRPASRLDALPSGPAPRHSLEDRYIFPLRILTNSQRRALLANSTAKIGAFVEGTKHVFVQRWGCPVI